jgi:TonB family protein
MGGGGLRVYGVLRGGKIYTIYLPMTGKNWILQFCRRQKSSATPPRSTGRTARLDYGLVPPSPDKQFDFHRLPVPEDKADEFIVLQGVIREDGSVDELRVLESIEAISDQAALAAFSRWKFQPALEAGKPVEVDILVGIPATIPEESEKRAAKSSGDS